MLDITLSRRKALLAALAMGLAQRAASVLAAPRGRFADPRDVAIATQGRVLVTDTGNARVQVFTRSGKYLTKWSAATIAPRGFDPIGLAVDSSNRVYIADTENDRVEVYTTSG